MKVLYATDGFDPAIAAGTVLEKIGDRDRLEVTVMSVTHSGMPAPEHAVLMLDPVEERRKDTVAMVDAACEKLIAAGFKATGHVAEGHPGPEIVRAVEDEWYDLVVMGAGGRSWLGNRLLGSVSSYVLHNSPESVMVVHDSLPVGSRGRVLVGTDGSRGATFTITALARLADPSTTDIKVVSAFEHPSPLLYATPGSFYIPPESPKIIEEERKHLRLHARRIVEASAVELCDAGYTVEGEVVEGHASQVLLEQATSGRFDLVAVGSRGLGPIRRALLGSVSDHVVRHAQATLVGRRLHA